MIAISGLLVIVAFVTLIVGVFQNGLSMIYVSIAASVAAAVSLATGVVRSRPKAMAVAGSEPLGTWGGTAAPVLDRPADEQAWADESPVSVVEEEPETQVLRLDEAEAAEPAAAPAKTTRARKAPAKSTSRASASTQTVVVVPGRDKFHKETCRYAKGQVTQSMTKAEAKKQGYAACGVCKP